MLQGPSRTDDRRRSPPLVRVTGECPIVFLRRDWQGADRSVLRRPHPRERRGPAGKREAVTIAYIVASHGDARAPLRLVCRLVADGARAVFMHHDAAWPALPASRDHRIVAIEDRIAVRWGDFSLVEVFLRSAIEIAERGHNCDWLVFLSGQDYPTAPLRSFESFLSTADVDGFIDYLPADERFAEDNRTRYGFEYHALPEFARPLVARAWRLNGMQPWMRLVANRAGCFAGRRDTTTFTDRFRPYRGSSWWTLARPCVDELLRFAVERPEVVAAYRRKLNPDESFVQTVLANAGRFRLVNDDLRYSVWPGDESGSPLVLGVQHLDALLRSGKPFARKFDERVDARVLDRLDELAGAFPMASGARTHKWDV